jgi:hypothetical protein
MDEEKITASDLCLSLYSFSKMPHKNLNTAWSFLNPDGSFLLWEEFVDHRLNDFAFFAQVEKLNTLYVQAQQWALS